MMMKLKFFCAVLVLLSAPFHPVTAFQAVPARTSVRPVPNLNEPAVVSPLFRKLKSSTTVLTPRHSFPPSRARPRRRNALLALALGALAWNLIPTAPPAAEAKRSTTQTQLAPPATVPDAIRKRVPANAGAILVAAGAGTLMGTALLSKEQEFRYYMDMDEEDVTEEVDSAPDVTKTANVSRHEAVQQAALNQILERVKEAESVSREASMEDIVGKTEVAGTVAGNLLNAPAEPAERDTDDKPHNDAPSLDHLLPEQPTIDIQKDDVTTSNYDVLRESVDDTAFSSTAGTSVPELKLETDVGSESTAADTSEPEIIKPDVDLSLPSSTADTSEPEIIKPDADLSLPSTAHTSEPEIKPETNTAPPSVTAAEPELVKDAAVALELKREMPSLLRRTMDKSTSLARKLGAPKAFPPLSKPALDDPELSQKYAAIDDLEERAFTILYDLGMVERTPDPDSPKYKYYRKSRTED